MEAKNPNLTRMFEELGTVHPSARHYKRFLQAAKTDRRFEDIVRESPFSALETFAYDVPITQTADEVVGRIFSTSFANPSVLGEKKDAFEKDLRDALAEQSPNGEFKKTDRYYLFIAKRS